MNHICILIDITDYAALSRYHCKTVAMNQSIIDHRERSWRDSLGAEEGGRE